MRRLGLLLVLAGVVLAGACSDSAGPAPVQSAYKINLRYFGRAMTASEQVLFTNAAARIKEIVVAAPPLVNATGADPAKNCGATGVAVFSGTIDGIVIYASFDSIDGRGKVLAQSGPCYIRQNGTKNDYRTSIGVMKFDTADVAPLAGSGNLQEVITHEMLHVLGFGSFWDTTAANLLISYGTNVSYIGAGGIAGCKSLGGINTCASSVPVEGTQGGAGTINSHWRESVFGNELMTGFINAGKNPLSIMTIRSLEDLGYTVDTTAADPYSHPGLNLRVAGSVADPSPTPGVWEIGLPHRPRALPTIPGTGR
ncbi:MAG TPA: leishmanolysin-related zinc metalloendopeptidase [Gemmatimonadaceae bacterium]|nr:leishmanolysin-related zinc metalloendopeptidase [Gemmatimonadaceae bacterium]